VKVQFIIETSEWEALLAHVSPPVDPRAEFEADPGRAAWLTLSAGDLVADVSERLVTDETIELLTAAGRVSTS